MATVYYPQFDCYEIDTDGRRVPVVSITLTTYNVTTSSAIGTASVNASGVVAQGSVTATAGDVIRFSHASYPEVFLLTLAATQAGAYTVENGLAYMMENQGDAVTSTQVDIYAQDIDNPDVAPWLIGSGASGTTVEVPYQSLVAKNLRLFPVSSADTLQRAAVDFNSSNYEDVAITAATETMDTADDSWESVRRNYLDTAFEAYDTRASRPLFDHFQSRNTTGTALETLHLYNAPRDTFKVNGDTIVGEYTGKLAANANDKYVYLKFAGTTILDTGTDIDPALGNNKKWRIHFTITRKSTSVVRYGVDFHVYGYDPYCTEGEITGLDLPDIGGLSAGTGYDLKLDITTSDAAGDATLTLANARFVNAPLAPIVSTSMWAYYEADSFNGSGVALPSDGANISTSWQDLSGNARHATVSGSPTFETNELNGLAAVRLGADSNDYFTIPDMSALSTAVTVFIVQKVNDVTTNAGHKMGSYSGNDSYYPYEPDTPDGIYDSIGSSDRKTCGPSEVTITSWHVTHVQSASNNWNLWQNGMLVHNDTSHTVGCSSTPYIGFNGAAYMKADIAAIYIYSNNMSALNAAKQYRYLAQKWGV